MSIEKNSIVRIADEKHPRHGQQGIVIDAGLGPEPLIKVWFGREYDHVMKYDDDTQRLIADFRFGIDEVFENEKDNPRIVSFEFEQLQPEDGWDLENLARRHWPENCDSFIRPAKPFVAGGRCQAKCCRRKTSQRIIFNFWDTLKTADVCKVHAAKYHLAVLEEEDFPWRGFGFGLLEWITDSFRPAARRHKNSNGKASSLEGLKQA